MTVNIITSNASGGDSLPDTVDLGTDKTPGTETDHQDIFIRHDAEVNPITDSAFYVTRYAGLNYLGVDADADYTELLDWGATDTDGIKLNQVIPPSWTIGDQFDTGDDQVIKHGYGDINSQLILDQQAINIGTVSEDGVIPVAGEAHVQLRVSVPTSVSSSGYRAFSLVFAYSATS